MFALLAGRCWHMHTYPLHPSQILTSCIWLVLAGLRPWFLRACVVEVSVPISAHLLLSSDHARMLAERYYRVGGTSGGGCSCTAV